jgi:hypothetical protein
MRNDVRELRATRGLSQGDLGKAGSLAADDQRDRDRALHPVATARDGPRSVLDSNVEEVFHDNGTP